MRLTLIKLAGFKSFVEPTSIGVPGSLVGIVGPNGCGKSNLIDAVRWVLGESRASALRGESMQDVIFNGSGERKPVARASVELVFDNSLGRAAGQWSQYAEIAVKRILQRDGESGYYINNSPVRRRDVQDIFLGTGVGPRAYAIVEQGTISRVIEARPDELRVFLEEAAGVSKYKERRRETGNRLDDTRENLARVDDILRELEAQIERLEKQAQVAREFQELQRQHTQAQHLLWWLRKREAMEQAGAAAEALSAVTTDIEAQTARLREIEKRLEGTRVRHYGATDRAGAVQASLYEVNGEIGALESELRHIADTRQRLQAQGVSHIEALHRAGRQQDELQDALELWRNRAKDLASEAAGAEARRGDETRRASAMEAELRAAQLAATAARSGLAETERALHVERERAAAAAERFRQIEARRERLKGEQETLAPPDIAAMDRLGAQIGGFDAQLARLRVDQDERSRSLPVLEAERGELTARLQELERVHTAEHSRLATLKELQSSADRDETLDGWLERHGISNVARLWSHISVAPGWERAVESVLRERLHGIALASRDAIGPLVPDAAPGNLFVALPDASASGEGTHAEHGGNEQPAQSGERARRTPLDRLVTVSHPGFAPVVQEWLSAYEAVEAPPARAELEALPAGRMLVDPQGTLYSRSGLHFYVGPSGDANILVRKREIERLGASLTAREAALRRSRVQLEDAERRAAGERGRVDALQQSIATGSEARHRVEIEWTRLRELAARAHARGSEIAAELAELEQARTEHDTAVAERADTIRRLEAEHGARRDSLSLCESQEHGVEQALAAQRLRLRDAERAAQEALFAVREADAKLDEIARTLGALRDQMAQLTRQEHDVRRELASLSDEELRDRLQSGLARRVDVERSLGEAREELETASAAMRETEEERLNAERALAPLRDRVAELRLKEQAAQLARDQYGQQLAEEGADESAVEAAQRTGRGGRPQSLQAEINRLAQQMAALGAINMAALDELAVSRERKEFLDAQAADLAEALSTLENAIRRIDLETRSLLQQTFDTVNANFAVLFPSLFGGGRAELIMTGDEILDAGVQVMAQPPGKRNASIHLLSGGEKALTAIALVFSLFRLNPAPFCLLDEVDAPLDDANTERFCKLVREMASETQFVFISHNKVTMEMATHLVGVTMQEQGVSRIVAVDIDEALKLREAA